MNTSKDALQGAWAALARGDLPERDRLCERAGLLLEAEQRATAISNLLAIDFYVTSAGVAYSTKAMAKAARVIQ